MIVFGMIGGWMAVLNFLKGYSIFFSEFDFGKSSAKLESKLNKTIKDFTEDIENFKYNMAIIKIRSLFDSIIEEREVSKKDIESFLKMFSVFCPHIAEEIWEKIGNKGFISLEKWPECNELKIDAKFEEQERNLEKAVGDILNVLKIVKEKQGKEGEKVFVYVMPFEINNYNSENISKKVGREVKIFAVNDKNKYDPEGKASKAKPGKPGIYIEC
jgi:leucyl-tRNA synthetase